MDPKLMPSFWLVGTTRTSKTLAMMRIYKTEEGWLQRSFTKGLNRDYVNSENVAKLYEWFVIDFAKFTHFEKEEEAFNFMEQMKTLSQEKFYLSE